MGLAWQQGPFGLHPAGRLLTGRPLPKRILYAEPAGRRMRVELAGATIARSDSVTILHETHRYPVAFFPPADVREDLLVRSTKRGRHPELGEMAWWSAVIDGAVFESVAWSYPHPATQAREMTGLVAFVWSEMDAFYEEDEQIFGHAVDPYHRVDVRTSSRRVTVRAGGEVVADTRSPLAVFETGFAPRWYVARSDVAADALEDDPLRTLCPYKGVAHYFDVVVGAERVPAAAWTYPETLPESARLAGYVSFDPELVEVWLDGERLLPAEHQLVRATGTDRDLTAKVA
jgi:uncharacterized protein (DUF427 family)